MPHCWSAFSGTKSVEMCSLFYIIEIFCERATLCPDFQSSQPAAPCALFIVFLLISPLISLRAGPGLLIFIFPNRGQTLIKRVMNECMHVCMNFEKFPPTWSWCFLHGVGPPCIKDKPHARFDLERIGFPESHHLRDLCFLVICNVWHPLLAA